MKSPRELDLPFDEWRTGQRLAIRIALNAKTPHVVIQAPTGFGKTALAVGLTRMDSRRQAMLTATLGLQDQYNRVAGTVVYDIRGMGNYECLAARDEFEAYFPFRQGRINCDEGPCRDGEKCTLKESGCTYFDRYRGALRSNAPLTNYKYWLSMRRYHPRGLGAVERLILDEAHSLPDELMSAHRIDIALSQLGATPIPFPWTAKGPDRNKLKKALDHYRSWAARKLDDLKTKELNDADQRRRRRELQEKLEQLAAIDDTWAWDIGDSSITFEPVIPKLLMPMLASAGTCRSFVHLSATITPHVLGLMGIPESAITFRAFPSAFPIERRPVYVVPSVRIDHRATPDHYHYWVHIMDQIIAARLDRNGIIHSVSYDRAGFILQHSKFRGMMVAPSSSRELARAVERFRHARTPMILLTPSVMTGWDFPYRDAEYQILSKVPFPNTNSMIMRARVHATAGYRDHVTMQSIVQAAGRIVRADDDQGETFIVDEHARWFLRDKKGLAPGFFNDAVSYPQRLPAPPPALRRAS